MKQSNKNTSFKFGTILFFIFLVLKLTDQIDWSWFWITLPLWGLSAIWITVIVGIYIIASICKLF